MRPNSKQRFTPDRCAVSMGIDTNCRGFLLLLILHLIFMQPGFGQAYEAQPCKEAPELKVQLDQGKIRSVTPRGPSFTMSGTSSMLAAPTSKRPAPPAPGANPMTASDIHEEYLKADDAWSCTYGPPNLTDGDIRTGWAEGAKGQGKGEVVIIPLPNTSNGVQIYSGYGKSETLWFKNSRPRLIEVSIFGQGWSPPVQGSMQQDLPLLGRLVIALQDTRGWQDLTLPPTTDMSITAPNTGRDVQQTPSYLAVRILDVYPGTQWPDTVISEIRARP